MFLNSKDQKQTIHLYTFLLLQESPRCWLIAFHLPPLAYFKNSCIYVWMDVCVNIFVCVHGCVCMCGICYMYVCMYPRFKKHTDQNILKIQTSNGCAWQPIPTVSSGNVDLPSLGEWSLINRVSNIAYIIHN